MDFANQYVEVIISVIGIIIGIVLVKEAREFFKKLWRKFLLLNRRIFRARFNRFILIQLVGIAVVAVLVQQRILNSEFLLAFVIFSIILGVSQLLVGFNDSPKLNYVLEKFPQYEKQTIDLIAAKEIRVKEVEEKWLEFLELLSNELSLVAVEGFLKMAKVFDCSGDTIYLQISPALESTKKVLQPRLVDVEPFLYQVYNVRYKLRIFSDLDLD